MSVGQSGKALVFQSGKKEEQEEEGRKKASAPTMGSTTSRHRLCAPAEMAAALGVPDYGAMPGPERPVDIPVRSYAPKEPAPIRKLKRPGLQVRFVTSDMILIAKMHHAVVMMFDVMRRLPGEGQGVRSQLGAIAAASGEESCDDPPPVRARVPSAAMISFMETVYQLLVERMGVDELGVKLVVGRALKHSWKDLRERDPKRHSRSMLNYLRNNALYQMAHTVTGARVIASLDIFPLDKLDKKAD